MPRGHEKPLTIITKFMDPTVRGRTTHFPNLGKNRFFYFVIRLTVKQYFKEGTYIGSLTCPIPLKFIFSLLGLVGVKCVLAQDPLPLVGDFPLRPFFFFFFITTLLVYKQIY